MSASGYSKGEVVMYSTNGICVVDDIQKMLFPMEREEKTYYVLRPVSSRNSTLFVPSDNELLMSKVRRLLTKEEIDEAIVGCDDMGKWIENRNARYAYFNTVLKNGNPRELLSVIKCIYARKAWTLEVGKKLANADEIVLSSAERLVREEFAYTLGIEEGEVAEYIRTKSE